MSGFPLPILFTFGHCLDTWQVQWIPTARFAAQIQRRCAKMVRLFYIYTTLDGISLDISIPPCIHINPNGYPSSLSPLIRSQMDESCTTIISPLYNRWCTITIMKKDFNVLPNICSLIHSIYHFHPLPSTHFQACGVGPHAPATQNKRLVVSLNKLWIYWD